MTPLAHLPISLKIAERLCLVVGGGEIAARKVGLLLRAGARVRVVALTLGPSLQARLDEGTVEHHAARFQPTDLAGMTLVIAATDDPAVNREVSDHAQALGIPVNVVDQPALCTFILPSIVDRAPVSVAVSTGGAAPVLARLLRARLETLIPADYGQLAALAAHNRVLVKRHLPDPVTRRRFWEVVLQGAVAEEVFAGRHEQAQMLFQQHLENASSPAPTTTGEVYLVGAGPGDPDLLTFRALRLMQQADVVLYDRLVSPAILDLVRREAERIYVGKRRAHHALRQDEINQTLMRLARAGKRVLRLKGGDPFIFGRGGEEIATLAAQGIAFQVVPGITAASGCAAYAGIPLTHRDYAQAVIFVTGQLQDGSVSLDWPMLARPSQTVVIYMGLTGLEQVCRELIRHGLPAHTPAALIEQGTTPHQRVIAATLADLYGQVSAAQVHAPTLVIVGEVVKLHSALGWYRP